MSAVADVPVIRISGRIEGAEIDRFYAEKQFGPALFSRGAGIAPTDAKLYPIYAPDYWATYFIDPDGIRLEITNYRQERRKRHDNW
jgi:hypothetical protein